MADDAVTPFRPPPARHSRQTFAYFSTFAYAFSLPRAVWNHESGRLILRPYCATRSSKLRAAAILLLSIALATATVLLPSNAVLHVVGTGALTFSMVSKPASRVTGVRKLTIFFCAYEVSAGPAANTLQYILTNLSTTGRSHCSHCSIGLDGTAEREADFPHRGE